MAHVLLLSIGPVQPFIASARRCRDLAGYHGGKDEPPAEWDRDGGPAWRA
ncbi:hypothetical protein [Sorangium sp. So ce1024]